MLYLIKSPKWTKTNKEDTYWRPAQNGYTTMIADAGYYSEEEANKITDHVSCDGAIKIALTQEILETAKRQCENKKDEIEKFINLENTRHADLILEFKELTAQNNKRCEFIDSIIDKITL